MLELGFISCGATLLYKLIFGSEKEKYYYDPTSEIFHKLTSEMG